MPTSEAQAEFDALINGTGRGSSSLPHPDDRARSHSHSPANGASNRNRENRTIRDGRYSRRDSDYEDEGSDHNPGQVLGQQGRNGKTRDYIPSTRRLANTGPKGVIADAQAFEQARLAHRSVLSLAQTGTAPSGSLRDKSNRRQDSRQRAGSSEDDDSGEDGFMKRWRATRLQELTNKTTPSNYLGQRSPSGRRYGNLASVDADGYLEAIENSGNDTVVCVFIYDDASDVSRLIEHAVIDIARAYQAVRFVKLHYEEAEMDEMGVPAMLAYRGGDKFADMIPIIDEIPLEDEFSAETLAAAMKRRGMLR